jgi:hypothetical protein
MCDRTRTWRGEDNVFVCEPGVAFPLVLTPGLTSQVRRESGAHKRDCFAKRGLSFRPGWGVGFGHGGVGALPWI